MYVFIGILVEYFYINDRKTRCQEILALIPLDYRSIFFSLPEDKRRALTKKSNIRGLCRFVVYLFMLAVITAYILFEYPGYQLAMIIQGITIAFLFTLLHETIHNTVFRAVWLNTAVAYFCGFLVFLGPVSFRFFHFAHHRYTHQRGKDPELITPKPQKKGAFLIYITGIPETYYRLKGLWDSAFTRKDILCVPDDARARVRLEARVFCLGYGLLGIFSVAYENSLLLWIWIVPVLLGNPFLRVYLLAEHTGCPHSLNMLENTRTIYTHSIVRFIAWNMPYHTEHHVHPGIPFHQLPVFNEILKDHLVNTHRGHGSFSKRYFESLPASKKADRIDA